MSVSLKEISKIVSTVLTTAEESVSEHEDLQKILFGTYTNGKARSLADAMSGEIFHPKDKLLIEKRIEKHEKKKKKKEKEGKKYAKINLDEFYE